ncbi:hypothetical protein EK904_005224 [Melospiza melodia maxima]|nr:hypothetical protein EK904_005224 [Melospiza melodia maxima]
MSYIKVPYRIDFSPAKSLFEASVYPYHSNHSTDSVILTKHVMVYILKTWGDLGLRGMEKSDKKLRMASEYEPRPLIAADGTFMKIRRQEKHSTAGKEVGSEHCLENRTRPPTVLTVHTHSDQDSEDMMKI